MPREKPHFDGLSVRNSQAIARKLMRQGKRWETTDAIRKEVLDFVVEVITDENGNPFTRLKAVDHLLKMELMNQVDERIENEEGRGVGGEEQVVVLLLPPNGTEAKGEVKVGGSPQSGLVRTAD